MTYDSTGVNALDYLPCRYGNSKLLFRGPRRDLTKPYVAFLGGTETYGKFLKRPFVDILDERLGTACVNFGCLNAGVDVFTNDPFVPDAAHKARVTVMQVPSAKNMSNRLYTVHPRRNDRFVSATRMLKSIFPDVDFAGFHFNKHMLSHLKALSPDRYKIVEQELNDAWIARMEMLLRRMNGRVVLLWVSQRAPEDQDPREVEPLHVTRAMIDQMREKVTDYVEVVCRDPAIAHDTDGMIFSPTEAPIAQEMLGARVHEMVADALEPVLNSML